MVYLGKMELRTETMKRRIVGFSIGSLIGFLIGFACAPWAEGTGGALMDLFWITLIFGVLGFSCRGASKAGQWASKAGQSVRQSRTAHSRRIRSGAEDAPGRRSRPFCPTVAA